jgi:hypothetical protein
LADSKTPALARWHCAHTDGIARWHAAANGHRQGQVQPDGTIWFGGFATFDRIDSTAQVRDWLAVRSDFKASVDTVLTLEVVQPIPRSSAPSARKWAERLPLAARWRHAGAIGGLPRDRAAYVKVIETRPIQ